MSGIVVEQDRYRLEVAPDGLLARLTSPAGERWLSLRLLSACDTTEGPDALDLTGEEFQPEDYEALREAFA